MVRPATRDDASAGSARARERRDIVLLMALALGVKTLVLAQLADHPLLQATGGLDAEAYVALAARVRAGDVWLGPGAYFVSPLYVYFLAVVSAVAGPSLLAARVAQVVLGTLAVGLVWDAARHFYDRRAALCAALLAILTGVITFNEILIVQSALDPFLTALSLWLLARALASGDPRTFIAVGAAVGLHALNRPNVLAWAVVLPLLLAMSGGRRRAAVAVAAGVALALAPVAARNRAVSGQWLAVSSHGGLNFLIGNNPSADGTYRAVPGITPAIAGQERDARRVAEARTGRPLADAEVSSHFYGEAMRWMRDQPRAAARLFLRKLMLVVNRADVPLNESYAYYREEEGTLLRALPVGAGILVPLGAVGLVLLARSEPTRAAASWAAFAPVYAIAVAAFFVSGRYRLPLLVPLCIGSGIALARAWDAVRKGAVRSGAGIVAATAAVALVANVDLGLDDGRAGERTEMILHLVDAGRWPEAEVLLARTETSHPQPALLYARVGQALREQGRLAEAVALFERALRVEPHRLEARIALGQALLEAGRPGEAVPHLRAAHEGGLSAGYVLGLALSAAGDARDAEPYLREAVAQSPGDAAAQLNLAVVLAQLGREDEARAHAKEALRLRPAYAQARGLLDALSK